MGTPPHLPIEKSRLALRQIVARAGLRDTPAARKKIALQSLRGVDKDEAAVRAAAMLPWSTGQVEGQINRLKTIKRQMYGRAKLDLLGRRFLLAA